MTAATLTLTEFLLARIGEDEAVAVASESKHWVYEPREGYGNSFIGSELYVLADEERTDESEMAHIARHDPTRVLAECEAKRRTVELHAGEHQCPGEWLAWVGIRNDREIGEHYEIRLCPTLRALAAVYADHPDYRDEWRP